ncbi:tripartite tricarboxylate transporter substrate binding protein [Comamonas piscis]|uniref:Tripartite tricarboxylate transporter substrate binding protein n=1 Tax=Comamonas piscis TaxID=1562974 RepID=A0A7G5EF94_9BURK|nr:tripartite tricarboxylate transporter substrate binding protein [Comamonas piscis]QMV72669.1 tripartite tricarboxylate transporter substrate binding protein [Comamonas piscis]WSO35440.1 tripartite tricarboxylate transporter substrate binding protein [Comamonas piscis]
MHFPLSRRCLLAATLATLASTGALAADNWPTKPLHLIVGFPAGSSPDLTARALAEPLEKALGQPIIVENKVGAGGNIAAEYVARATDGYTFSVMINGNMTIAKMLNPSIRYNPLTDLQPVGLIGVAPLVLVAPAKAPEGKAFFEAATQAGNSWSYGSPGVGTIGHLGMELLKSRAKIKPEHIPYPGYPQVFNGIQGGDLQLSMLPPALAMNQIQAGKLRGIGVTSAARSPLAPGLPSLKELGIANYDMEIWNAVAAPKAMPKAHVEKLALAVGEIVRSPEMRQKLALQGWQAVGSSPEGLKNRIDADVKALGTIIEEQNIRAQ